jgi:hypothetical protein
MIDLSHRGSSGNGFLRLSGGEKFHSLVCQLFARPSGRAIIKRVLKRR